jgi:AraC-like DNA-binding protein
MGSQTLVVFAAIYAAGIGIGALLAALLWTTRRGNHAANRWLALAAAALSVLTAGSLLEDTRLVLQVPHLGHVTDWLIAGVGPCVWLYVRRLTGRDDPRGARLALHFGPTAALVAYLAPFYALDGATKLMVLRTELEAPPPAPNLILLAVGAQMLAYWIAALTRLLRYRRHLRDQYSSTERLAFRWLLLVLTAGIVVWTVWMLGQVWNLEAARLPNALAVPLAFYGLAFFGLRQPAVFLDGRSGAPPAPARTPSPAAGARSFQDASPAARLTEIAPVLVAPPAEDSGTKYERSGLDPARRAEFVTRLNAVMDSEKPWLENDLTLAGLAARVGISPHHLSQVLNVELGCTFFDYVNERRVREVQRCLHDPAYASQSILEIALASGFNSKTAFNSAFKTLTGQTPSQFRAGVAAAPAV